ncbi:hypothetical protein LRP67_16310 [Nocardioides sp. cx-169]|nr:hypothetical protein [Nocardioides sp. cx-169]MCD4535657.1 hypothetical protein [Nocardioides sp. cx-169]
MNLDYSYPQGVPTSAACRHCMRARIVHNGALLCRICDGDADKQGGL